MFAAQNVGFDQRKRAREEEELANANGMSFSEHRNVSFLQSQPRRRFHMMSNANNVAETYPVPSTPCIS